MAFCIDRNDEEKQAKGTWAKYDGGEFLIAYFSNPNFQRTLNRLQAPYRKKIDKDKLDVQTGKRIMCQAMAEGLLLDWKNVVDGNDNDVPYSKETAMRALANDDDFRDFVQEFAMDGDNYRAEFIDKVVK